MAKFLSQIVLVGEGEKIMVLLWKLNWIVSMASLHQCGKVGDQLESLNSF